MFRRTDALALSLYSALIFYLSAQSDPVPSFIPWISVPFADKAFHAVEYGLLGCLWLRALRRAGWAGPVISAPSLAFIICLIYAVPDEWLQRYVTNRISSVGDLTADGIGAALGVAICRTPWGRRISHAEERSSSPGGAVTY